MAAEDRILELEVRIAFQEKAIAALSDVVREFAERVAGIERELAELRKVAIDREPIGPADERPPHY